MTRVGFCVSSSNCSQHASTNNATTFKILAKLGGCSMGNWISLARVLPVLEEINFSCLTFTNRIFMNAYTRQERWISSSVAEIEAAVQKFLRKNCRWSLTDARPRFINRQNSKHRIRRLVLFRADSRDSYYHDRFGRWYIQNQQQCIGESLVN